MGRLPPDETEGLLVDRRAGPDRHDLHDSVGGLSVHDPELPDPEAPESAQLVTQSLARGRIRENRVER